MTCKARNLSLLEGAENRTDVQKTFPDVTFGACIKNTFS